ncbi:MAG: SelB C-terminal domain-containing protein, partial [Chthoniobacterales bacterium]
LQILNYLGVRYGMVALTKCDLGDPARVAAEVRERLRGTSLGEVPIVATSTRTGAGLQELKQALEQVCEKIPSPRDFGKPRLFVDRVFTVHGTGTVVTGTLSGGALSRGETVLLQPQNLSARLRGLQSHNASLETALPGMRTALNLPDLRPEEIPRGSVVTTLAGAEASQTIDVLIERSARSASHTRPFKNAAVLQLHYGSARFAARVLLLDRRELLPGERAIGRLQLARPIFVFAGDRFIIRDASGRQTIAGGIVLHPAAEDSTFRAPQVRSCLEARAAAPHDLENLLVSLLRRDRMQPRDGLLAQSNFSEAEIAAALDRLARAKTLVVSGAFVADAGWWKALRDGAIEAIDAEHRAHPERSGLELARLRAHLTLSEAELENALVADLCQQDFSCAQGTIKRQGHLPSLPAALKGAGEKIRTALGARPFDPPSRKELSADPGAQPALRFLLDTGEVVLLGDDVPISADAFAQMKSLIAQALRQRGAATVSELRQVLGTTRRVTVPLLERCDRDGLTKREGDRRRLR